MGRQISALYGSGSNHTLTGAVASVVALAFLMALAVGFGAGVLGRPLLGMLILLPFGVAVFKRPFLGIVLIAAIIPLDYMLTFDGLGLSRVVGLTVFAAWVLQKLVRRQSWKRVVSGSFFPTAVLFLAWVLTSMLWATHPNAARSGFIRLAQMVALAIIFIDLVDSRRKMDVIAKTLMVSAFAAASITLYQGQVLGIRRAGADVAGGINGTAILLVTLLPLGFYVLRTSRSRAWKVIATAFLGISLVSVVLTYSRFNLLLIPPLVAVLFALTLRERRARGWLLAVSVAGAIAATTLVPWDKLARRTATIEAYVDQTLQFGRAQTITSSRGYHLRIGLAIARDHPLIGVGYGNYGYFFRDEYQFQVPGSNKLYGSVRSPHSAYVGIAADLGSIGLAIWLLLLGSCAASVLRARGRARTAGLHDLLPGIDTIVVMLGLHIFAYGFYEAHQMDKLLWLIMGACFAIGYIVIAESAAAELGGRSYASVAGFTVSEPSAGSLRRKSG